MPPYTAIDRQPRAETAPQRHGRPGRVCHAGWRVPVLFDTDTDIGIDDALTERLAR